MTTQNIGDEGFRWFVGVVENRDDPLMLGRLKVRAYNIHSESQSMTSTDELPWALVMNTVNNSNLDKVGKSPTGIQVGTTVIGFFMDGSDGNNPVIMGSLAGIPGNNTSKHDVSYEARGIDKVTKTPIGPEPASAYAAKYPYNKVLRTESGHVIEIDDTPGAERIQLYHTSGTYFEIDQNGRSVTKVNNDDYQIIAGDSEVYIQGNINVKVLGNATIAVDGNVDLTVGGNYNAQVGGTYTVNSGGNMKFTAPNINLN